MSINTKIAVVLACGVGLLVSACADEYPPGPPPPGVMARRHVRFCLNHHPGYDPRTNLFPAPDGAPRQCVAPWER